LNSTILPNQEPNEFQKCRIGDECDFIYNLLEQASKLNEKCRIDIQKTLKMLNEPSEINSTFEQQKHQFEATIADLKYTSNEVKPSCSSSLENNHTLTEEEILKNAKKLKAKQRQQKLLAQMSSNQKAFLSNPINKIEIEAFGEAAAQKSNELTPSASSLNTKNIDSSDLSSSYKEEKMNHNECEESNFQKNEINLLSKDQEEEEEEMYDCCICRLSTKATPDRPIGVVTLLQVGLCLFFLEKDDVAIINLFFGKK
jgi:hypothetical protein